MSPATFKISKMQASELDAFINLYSTVFQLPTSGIFMPIYYPMGLSDPQVHKRLEASHNIQDPNNTFLVARETSTDEMIGVAAWSFIPDSERGDLEAEVEKARHEAFETRPLVPGMRMDLARAMIEATCAARYAAPRPRMELDILAVQPEYGRQGIASALIEEGLRMADERRLPVYLCAALQGKALYERYGFEVTSVLPLDARDFGAGHSCRHWNMVRPARS